MIIEYKLVREMDQMRTPSWVLDGGYFPKPDDFTFIGITHDDNVRQFYLPDTVVSLTRQQLIDRVLGIHANTPMLNAANPASLPSPMTNAEVTALVNAWCDSKGE